MPRCSRSRRWPGGINAELDRLFPKDIEILAEPGRFLVATAGTAVAKVIGKARRDGKLCYYIDDGVYHTYSGIIFDHCQYHLKALQERADGDLLRLRPDLRRPGHDLAGRGLARTGAGRSTSTAGTSAPTAAPRPPGSTASRRPRWCT